MRSSTLWTAAIVAIALDRGAAADPSVPEAAPWRERGFLGGGIALTVDSAVLNTALELQGGEKLGGAPVWVRVTGAGGGSSDFDGAGTYYQGLIGAQVRTCSGPRGVCGFAGLDAGYETQTWSASERDREEESSGVVFGGHAGLEMGGERTRFRFTVILLSYRREQEARDGTRAEMSSKTMPTGGISLAIVHRL
jgi:hypothetical protein